jgi:sortase (surface protein transpeptidase)
MRIERIGLDAPLGVKTRDRAGLMQDPSGPEDIAWYDFTARPGEPGNAVFSGHVDYHDYGPAVFAHLRELQPGDAIDVFSADGSTHRYAVATRTSYAASEAPIDLIVGPTARASITLITCTGAFGGGEYSHRLVVRAEAV